MSETKTLRLIIPEWHGGMNPNYVFGSELLERIAPPDAASKTVKIHVDADFDGEHIAVDGVDCGGQLLAQMSETERVLQEKQPDRLIVFGGDCSVSQAPFDYLSGKYGDRFGVIWLDAHPDISGTGDSSHLHEMVLADLIGLNPGSPITAVKHPVDKKHVVLAGLIEKRLRVMDRACKEQGLKIISPEALKQNRGDLLNWLHAQKITKVAVHWDLDVLTPEDFRSIYPAEPYVSAEAFPAAVGQLTLREVGRILNDVSNHADLVGLSITEHLPWDAFNLRRTLASIPIFEQKK